jgi:hypothetical protein
MSSSSRGIALLSAALCLATFSLAQTLTSGDIAGTVTDPTGAVLPNARVDVKNNNTGAMQNAVTGSNGAYRVAFLPPGPYTVTAQATGFQTTSRTVNVQVGQAATVDFQIAVATSSTSVDVTEAPPAIQTENGNIATTFNTEQLTFLPNPGGDLTYVAQTAPGVIMNTQAGYGNFSSFGLPATSNLFTINGQNNNDPYFNINNSGATNLLLGNNEIAEATVVNNGYSTQYGQLAGSQVNYVTKSGTNTFHGNALWWWNGRRMNANNFFNNAGGVDRPFDNANQWAASIGGPIWKNRTFFFVNYEGINLVFPSSSTLVRIPSPQFAQAAINNLNATGQAAQVPYYQQIFKLYSGVNAATTPGGCPANTSQSVLTALAGAPCVLNFRSAAGNSADEYVVSGRVDHQLGANDRMYVRMNRDNGSQPTYTDPINPIFNVVSKQPQYGGNLGETHTFGASAVNQFILSGTHYSAVFSPPDLAATLGALPTTLTFTGGFFTNIGGTTYNYPQGRRDTQYQIVDDFSKVIGRHQLRTGVNFVRNDISELSYSVLTSGLTYLSNINAFYNGTGAGTRVRLRFPSATSQPLALYNLGIYLQDDWKISPNFTLNLGLRAEHNSNPVCQHDCFASLKGPFPAVAANINTPYNQMIQTGLHQAYPAIDNIVWSPRIGFAWNPGGKGKTVIRGGAGIFYNALPGIVARAYSRNSPQLNEFNLLGGPIAPGVPGSLFTLAQQTNQQFLQAFANGATLAGIRQVFPGFNPPAYTSASDKLHTPQYQEWNLEIQRELPGAMTFSANYVGNHGINGLYANPGLNAYCPASACGGSSFMPTSAPNPLLSAVTYYQTGSVSNYNGVVVSLRKRMSAGLSFGANYTYSHALDEISNGGVLQFDLLTAPSILAPIDPRNLRRLNYGNNDADIRHYFSANYLWDDVVRRAYHGGPNMIFGGWTISGTWFYRTGLPFTVVDTAAGQTLAGFNYTGAVVPATVLGAGNMTCGKSAVNSSCFGSNQFAAANESPTGFGNQSRNQFRGPNFFNTDLQVTKNFVIRERMRLGVGAQFFNLFNHPNFDKPVNDVNDPSFGMITSTVGSPTSIFGAFNGGDASPRLIQLKAQLIF